MSGLWVDRILSIAGGGTGGSDAASARVALGLGTMAVQNNNAVNISDGTLSGNGVGLTNLNASNLANGTIPDARFPAILPAVSGQNLVTLNASQLSFGIIPDGRFPAILPAVSGQNLTTLNASNLALGVAAPARLGTGTPNNTNFLRGDGVWAEAGMIKTLTYYSGSISVAQLFSGNKDVVLSPSVLVSKSYAAPAAGHSSQFATVTQNVTYERVSILNTNTFRFHNVVSSNTGAVETLLYAFWVIEHQ